MNEHEGKGMMKKLYGRRWQSAILSNDEVGERELTDCLTHTFRG
jgi:hypothetical protein